MHPQQRVSLPSIHEMFPNYLALPGHPLLPPHNSRAPTRASVSKPFSFDVLRSDPITSSLQHISSSTTLTKRGVTSGHDLSSFSDAPNGSIRTFRVTTSPPSSPHARVTSAAANTGHKRRDSADKAADNSAITCETLLAFPASGTSVCQTVGSRNDADSAPGPNRVTIVDGHEGLPTPPATKGRKHECSMCGKRFNRPSSLRIHVNTHTGATPFRCPHPTCGREFNVNSNMRRHYRNHALPALNRASRYPSPSHGITKITRGARTSSRSPRALRSRTRTRSDDGEDDELNSDDEEDSDDNALGMSWHS